MNDHKKLTPLLQFLNASPTAWHAVANLKTHLVAIGFQEIDEGERWKLKPGKGYFVSRNGSSLCAFMMPKSKPTRATILGSHTDSPGLKLKPAAEFRKEHMVMLGTEIYGAPLLNSWLNRDLGIAGRICCLTPQGKVVEKLVSSDAAPVAIPQLAIHLDRSINESGLVLNKQEHLSALASLDDGQPNDKPYLQTLFQKEIGRDALVSHDLFLYPLEPARFIGLKQEMIAGPRIDNLCSAHAIATALSQITAIKDTLVMGLFWDHEEIGSESAQGAGSPFLPHLLERILLAAGVDREGYFNLLNKSQCISVDLGHALNPNYPEKSEPQHKPLLSKGIIIKSNAQHRYASDARSTATIIKHCRELDIPYQHFVARGDIPCGSTIGPITANLTGIATVDIGIPQLSMHASRELIATQDQLDLCKLLTRLGGPAP